MRTLLVVDLQNDFMPFGALPVREGDALVPVANSLMPGFDLVVASQDWHPPDHGSFASAHRGKRPGEFVMLGGVQQILWPDHCVQDTPGASLHSAVDVAEIDFVVRKGTDREIDSYSAFFDNGHRKDTGLAAYLREREVRDFFIMGLATDYCVKYSALDALDLGFEVAVIADACRAVEVSPGDAERAIEEMRRHGAQIATVASLRP